MLVAGKFDRVTEFHDDAQFLPIAVRSAVRRQIYEAQSVADLISLFSKLYSLDIHIVGSRDYVYPSDIVVNRLVSHAWSDPRYLTRTFGLRAKFVQLTEGYDNEVSD